MEEAAKVLAQRISSLERQVDVLHARLADLRSSTRERLQMILACVEGLNGGIA